MEGQRLISIAISASDPSDPKTYTFADVSHDPKGTVLADGDINLDIAGINVPTTVNFTIAANIHDYAAWNTDQPSKNIAIEASTADCDPNTGVPSNWTVSVSSDGCTLSVYDPNDPAQPQQYAYTLHLKGRHGNHKHDVALDPKFTNGPPH